MNPFEIVVLVLESAVQTVGVRAGVETPAYRTLMRDGPVELREYPARVVAETTVSGPDEMAARNAGFRKVAGYIFGDNKAARQVAMTTPVAQKAAGVGGQTIAMTSPVVQKPASETIAMTSPVVQSATAGQGVWKIQFVMPAKYTLATLPQPDDPSVKLLQEPPARYAVARFSGSRSAAAVAQQTRALMAAAAARGWKTSGPTVAWFYDPPWTVPAFRRNEVAVRVQ